jgi:hypothetical protein
MNQSTADLDTPRVASHRIIERRATRGDRDRKSPAPFPRAPRRDVARLRARRCRRAPIHERLCNRILVATTFDRGKHDSHSDAERAAGNRERGVPSTHVGQRIGGFVSNFDDCRRLLDCEHTGAGLVALRSPVRSREAYFLRIDLPQLNSAASALSYWHPKKEDYAHAHYGTCTREHTGSVFRGCCFSRDEAFHFR